MNNSIKITSPMYLHLSDLNQSMIGENYKFLDISDLISLLFKVKDDGIDISSYEGICINFRQNIPGGKLTELTFQGDIKLHKKNIEYSIIGSTLSFSEFQDAIVNTFVGEFAYGDFKRYDHMELEIYQSL